MRRTIIPYDRSLKTKEKELRNNSTLAEILLWKKLKGKQFFGYDFHRQKPLLKYIVDFYCAELNMVIEIDGLYHNDPEVFVKDQKRQEELEKYGLHFLRFSEQEVMAQMNSVLRVVEIYIKEFEAGV